VVAVLVLALAGCATPRRPPRATVYDFGSAEPQAQAASSTATPIVLAEVETAPSLEGNAMLYRLAYSDDYQLHPYSEARWSAPPAQLVRQRLRSVLERDRAVLDSRESAALARSSTSASLVLRVDLEEFSQLFESQARSIGLLRLRATLFESTAGGERLIAQRVIVQRLPAASPDASGGVRALAAATDAAGEELRRWLAAAR
jgi:cholesterol transport system auxiliary component